MASKPAIEDPITILPPEIVLRILDFTSIPALASLTAVSRAWHAFIDTTHQDAIYSSKTPHPPNARDFSFLDDAASFSKIYAGCSSWKDLCERRTLLARNWNSRHPITRESVLQVGNDAVWRFKPDFKRRFFISTSHSGGLNVSDMDTGHLLWRLPSPLEEGENTVRHFAHLEYQDGTMVFDREGDAVEVWQHVSGSRGQFTRTAILEHTCQTRGFQLSYHTLVVVSTEGLGFVYDMKSTPPKLTTSLEIEPDAVGHLDQNADVVIYSMGTRGYHVYSKSTGEMLGILQPSHCKQKFHINPLPPVETRHSALGAIAGVARASRPGPRPSLFPPQNPLSNRLDPIDILPGPLPTSTDPADDEWGAGMLDRTSSLFVGVSRNGRLFICRNPLLALSSPAALAQHSTLLECTSDGSSFDLGGWLSVANQRVLFEVKDTVYIIKLTEEGGIDEAGHSWAMGNSFVPQISVPVSYMGVVEDAIISTYTTLGRSMDEGDGPHRIVPTKVIRIISFAPHPDDDDVRRGGQEEQQEWDEETNGHIPPVQFLGDEDE